MERLRKLNRDSCGAEMTTEESRRIQLDMLRALAAFCDENGLRYFLSGGTLLGAIRHQGFIPWDDDIDLMMPRKDFEKLKTVFEAELGERFTLCAPELGRGHGMTVCQIKRRGTGPADVGAGFKCFARCRESTVGQFRMIG